ncbi:MAG: tRNA preQ1(34) S-adenosylmethionine ribosyltransferase-isomerase QueA, partial [bacterium]
MYRLEDYYFDLPQELIAQEPVEPRDHCRLLLLSRKTGELKEDFFYNIGNYLSPGDILVLNDAKVIPARIFGKRSTGGKIELLLIHRLSDKIWKALIRPARRIKPGSILEFGDNVFARVESRDDDGSFIVSFKLNGDFDQFLEREGHIPLPPYIRRDDTALDRIFYQTVYAEKPGAIAAPTAGLHFTERLINELKAKGINFATLTLFVGWGTFKKVKVRDIREHKMDSEHFIFPRECGMAIAEAKRRNSRVIAVGTTVARVLETIAPFFPKKLEFVSSTNLFIYPGFKFM